MCYGIDCMKDIASLWLESWTKKPKRLGVTLIDSWLYVCLSHINTISLVFCVKTFKMFCSKHNINRFYRHLNTKETMFLQRKRRDLTHTHTQKVINLFWWCEFYFLMFFFVQINSTYNYIRWTLKMFTNGNQRQTLILRDSSVWRQASAMTRRPMS